MKENRAVLKVNLREAFRKWLELTRTFNKLTNREIDFLSLLLYHRYLIAKEIKSELYLNKILFGTELRKQIREDLGIKPQVFLNVLSKLRKKGIIINNTIHKGYVPSISENTLRITFDLKIEGND